MTRRKLIQAFGLAAGASLASSAFGQGRCRDGYGTKGCPESKEKATAPIQPVFAPTRWKTTGLDRITWEMPEYRKEAAFYIALMGWKLRSDDGVQAVLDIGGWGSAVFKHNPERKTAVVTNFGFAIEPWDEKAVETDLRKRGMTPVADNSAGGFESFHVKDPNGFDLQIANRRRLSEGSVKSDLAEPFKPTGWETVWLDHFSYNADSYKRAASFYMNLLGWKPTYDEGSQHELTIGDVGDVIIRGTAPTRRPRIDHISFGIRPWDTDGVKEALEKRGLEARPDTSTHDEIHVAAYKSYHTTTPNGFNLQISYVGHDNRLALPTAVKPKALR